MLPGVTATPQKLLQAHQQATEKESYNGSFLHYLSILVRYWTRICWVSRCRYINYSAMIAVLLRRSSAKYCTRANIVLDLHTQQTCSSHPTSTCGTMTTALLCALSPRMRTRCAHTRRCNCCIEFQGGRPNKSERLTNHAHVQWIH